MSESQFDETQYRWMDRALELAGQAANLGEVPVGAVIVSAEGELLGEGFNQPIKVQDPTAHAEIMAIRQACRKTGNYRLPGAVLYVTLEPCAMCAGAIVHARLARVVFATCEPKAGAVESTLRFFDLPQLNHRVEYTGGLRRSEASSLLSHFFQSRREEKALLKKNSRQQQSDC